MNFNCKVSRISKTQEIVNRSHKKGIVFQKWVLFTIWCLLKVGLIKDLGWIHVDKFQLKVSFWKIFSKSRAFQINIGTWDKAQTFKDHLWVCDIFRAFLLINYRLQLLKEDLELKMFLFENKWIIFCLNQLSKTFKLNFKLKPSWYSIFDTVLGNLVKLGIEHINSHFFSNVWHDKHNPSKFQRWLKLQI